MDKKVLALCNIDVILQYFLCTLIDHLFVQTYPTHHASCIKCVVNQSSCSITTFSGKTGYEPTQCSIESSFDKKILQNFNPSFTKPFGTHTFNQEGVGRTSCYLKNCRPHECEIL